MRLHLNVGYRRPSTAGEISPAVRRAAEPVIHWQRRWRRDRGPASERRTLTSAEGYRIVEAVPDCTASPVRVYALRNRQTVLKVCRTVQAARIVCERHRKAELRALTKSAARPPESSNRRAPAGL